MKQQYRKQEIAEALRRLATTYALTIRQFEDTLAHLCRELHVQEISWSELHLPLTPKISREWPSEPIADRLTLSVRWHRNTCFLGNTLLFRFFEALSRRPNRYCPISELLDEVWGGPRASASVRNVVKRLRDKLTAAGMRRVATAIDGRTHGHFALRLDRLR